MTQLAQPRRYSVHEYFEYDNATPGKHEFRAGEILLMAGGTPEQSLVIANVIRELGNRLKGTPCRVYDSNLRVRALSDIRYCYPDVTVICGEVQYDPQDDSRQTAINPRLVIEVLSPSSERGDRGEKFQRYLKCESLQEYVLVLQEQPRVETYSRQTAGGWHFEGRDGLDSAANFLSLNIELPLAEVYDGIRFPELAAG